MHSNRTLGTVNGWCKKITIIINKKNPKFINLIKTKIILTLKR